MGILILIIPIAIYYFILKAVLKNYDETKKRFKKRTVFIALLILPFLDHIVGYGVYKYLCYTSGGVKIYKTVTDEQEQRDYWIDSYNQKRVNGNIGTRYGLVGHKLLTKDFKHHKTIYTNNCKSKSKRWKTYDCQKANKYVEDSNLKIYTYDKNDNYVPRNKYNQSYIDKSSLKSIWIIAEDTLEKGYLNYCNDKYDNLSITDKNYNKSCSNANRIIKKYSLKNVIKVPKSKYILKRNMDKAVTPVIRYIVKDEQKIVNRNTDEILGENQKYQFLGGLFINVISMYLYPQFRVRCHEDNFYNLENIIIPNPYKNQEGK